MRLAIPLLVLALAACGEPVRDDHFANDVKPERQDPALTTSAAPVRVGELGPSFDACGAVGTSRRIAAGDVLEVRAAPFSTAARTGALSPGARFFVCSRSHDQKWFGIVYDPAGGLSPDCKVSSPIAARRDYAGPCGSGWVSSAFVKLIAGDGLSAAPEPEPPRPSG